MNARVNTADWLALLEMFSDTESLLQGAAGEDAMNVGDVRAIVLRLREAETLITECRSFIVNYLEGVDGTDAVMERLEGWS